MRLKDIAETFLIAVVSSIVSGFIILWQNNSLVNLPSIIGLFLACLGLLFLVLCEIEEEKRMGWVFLIIGFLIGIVEWILNIWAKVPIFQ